MSDEHKSETALNGIGCGPDRLQEQFDEACRQLNSKDKYIADQAETAQKLWDALRSLRADFARLREQFDAKCAFSKVRQADLVRTEADLHKVLGQREALEADLARVTAEREAAAEAQRELRDCELLRDLYGESAEILQRELDRLLEALGVDCVDAGLAQITRLEELAACDGPACLLRGYRHDHPASRPAR